MWRDRRVRTRVNAQLELEGLEENRQHYTEPEYNRLRERWIRIIEDNI